MGRTPIREIPPHSALRTNDAPASTQVASERLSGPAQPEAIPGRTTGQAPPLIDDDKIRELAYFKWQAAGSPPGDGIQFWLEAENELASVAQTED